MTLRDAIAVAAGGAVGSLARAMIDAAALRLGFVAEGATLLINVTGACAAGMLVALIVERGVLPADLRPLLVVGLLGGFTTFSTFAVQLARLGSSGEIGAGLLYAAASLFLGIAAAALGLFIGRSI
jgi:CrcB protein